jgi:hypothetical protein
MTDVSHSSRRVPVSGGKYRNIGAQEPQVGSKGPRRNNSTPIDSYRTLRPLLASPLTKRAVYEGAREHHGDTKGRPLRLDRKSVDGVRLDRIGLDLT